MAIAIEHVSKYYGRQKALDDIGFSLKKGEICGFLGPNGAGKSTTMKIITGFLGDFTGQVQVCGIDIRKYPLQAKACIGYLPEHNPLYPDMFIKEYLLHIARLYRMDKPVQRVKDIIELTGLVPEERKKIGELSKGYRQRVGLAQALVHQPEVLILDEPMTGLDPNQLEEIRHLIIRIGKDKTVLLSTHIMQEVEAICDRIIIIDQGVIVTDKLKSDLHRTSGNSMVIEVAFAPGSETQWLQDAGLPLQSATPAGTDRWQLIGQPGEDPRIALFNAAAAHRSPIIALRTEEKNLEEIFRDLTMPQR